jgi:DUF1365 family protein
MALANALMIAQVLHARQRPQTNAFRYHVYYLCARLSDLKLLSRLWLFSLNGWNLFSLRERDYGRHTTPDQWIRGVLTEWNLPEANGEIVLMTMPRIVGYAFNPVSFWFCLDQAGALRAVLADVSNTFGEHHAYLMHHDDGRSITANDWLKSNKIFHVSPFMEVTGHYEFRFAYSEDAIGVWINHHDENGLLLTTSVAGKRQPLTAASLLRCFFRYPLVTLKVITLIHVQAFRLMAKGIRYHTKPTPPTHEISR